ncbi:hypothetical protein HELRODRAFT_165225 [Helobdella robusta]|uniref:Ig-like domain-containing protein n=1 Tax=Helobdella robusta TaxID=6412 RepID=T1EWG5_HELRO|nr:hypothetical protein HELRODRAFT_165225 [Helobdella robusta]ESN93066.1 hypothetical protein HELRODRAFT_165225 [Helobdella robusta]
MQNVGASVDVKFHKLDVKLCIFIIFIWLGLVKTKSQRLECVVTGGSQSFINCNGYGLNLKNVSHLTLRDVLISVQSEDVVSDSGLISSKDATVIASSNTTLNLDFSYNEIQVLEFSPFTELQGLRGLNISHNHIREILADGIILDDLISLDISFNYLTTLSLKLTYMLPSLEYLNISANHFLSISIPNFDNLRILVLKSSNFLANITGRLQNSLQNVIIEDNKELKYISNEVFENLTSLSLLDLKFNNLNSFTFLENISRHQIPLINVAGNAFKCHCYEMSIVFKVFNFLISLENASKLIGFSCVDDFNSIEYSSLFELYQGCTRYIQSIQSGIYLARVNKPLVVPCSWKAKQDNETSSLFLTLSSSLASSPPLPSNFLVFWVTNRNTTFYRNSNTTLSLYNSYNDDSQLSRFSILPNNNLMIRDVSTSDAGRFVCYVASNATTFEDEFTFHNHTNNITSAIGSKLKTLLTRSSMQIMSNFTVIIKLDYSILSTTTICSIIVGFLTAAAFSFLSIILAVARYTANNCSKKAKRKKKSIREILVKMSGFKSAQMDRLSAYKSAKMDQLLAFKSATMDQFSAFKLARIDRLRTYKQSTVTTVLSHMDRMREHYYNQSTRIKENCSLQVDRLRETYENGCGRLKDYKCQRIEKMRENYLIQVNKIREYGLQQISRLRDQYKMQQQYLLKLLELIEVGNCMTVIEAECLKTESAIFNTDIPINIDANSLGVVGGVGEMDGSGDQSDGEIIIEPGPVLGDVREGDGNSAAAAGGGGGASGRLHNCKVHYKINLTSKCGNNNNNKNNNNNNNNNNYDSEDDISNQAHSSTRHIGCINFETCKGHSHPSHHPLPNESGMQSTTDDICDDEFDLELTKSISEIERICREGIEKSVEHFQHCFFISDHSHIPERGIQSNKECDNRDKRGEAQRCSDDEEVFVDCYTTPPTSQTKKKLKATSKGTRSCQSTSTSPTHSLPNYNFSSFFFNDDDDDGCEFYRKKKKEKKINKDSKSRLSQRENFYIEDNRLVNFSSLNLLKKENKGGLEKNNVNKNKICNNNNVEKVINNDDAANNRSSTNVAQHDQQVCPAKKNRPLSLLCLKPPKSHRQKTSYSPNVVYNNNNNNNNFDCSTDDKMVSLLSMKPHLISSTQTQLSCSSYNTARDGEEDYEDVDDHNDVGGILDDDSKIVFVVVGDSVAEATTSTSATTTTTTTNNNKNNNKNNNNIPASTSISTSNSGAYATTTTSISCTPVANTTATTSTTTTTTTIAAAAAAAATTTTN